MKQHAFFLLRVLDVFEFIWNQALDSHFYLPQVFEARYLRCEGAFGNQTLVSTKSTCSNFWSNIHFSQWKNQKKTLLHPENLYLLHRSIFFVKLVFKIEHCNFFWETKAYHRMTCCAAFGCVIKNLLLLNLCFCRWR